MPFDSLSGLVKESETGSAPLWKIILEDDCRENGMTEDSSVTKMKLMWNTMKKASAGYEADRHSLFNLSGGDGGKMHNYAAAEEPIGGAYLGAVIEEALKMGESNACMKRIVAAPTAGSCGVLPAVLLPLERDKRVTEDEIIHAMYVAAGFGRVIAARATISGAEGGCQAEIGAASAMAAAALVSLRHGTPAMCAHACAMAVKNLLGLVCDPVAGLVEIPCVKRNVVGAVNAISCADMALAGIESRIPPDEVIDAMRSVGDMLPSALRETSKAGLAATPTAIKIAEKVKDSFKKQS